MDLNTSDQDIRVIQLDKVRARIDKALTSLDRGEGTDGEKFMQEMLSDLDSQETKPKVATRKRG